jgi:hypothetical protein
MKTNELKPTELKPASQISDEAAMEAAMEEALSFLELIIQDAIDREKGVPPWLK